MRSNPIFNISPVDGRYYSKTEVLTNYFSEYALIKYRVEVEIKYLLVLSNAGLENLSPFSEHQTSKIESIYKHFALEDAERIKEIEREINHDVKAVEYFIKEQLEAINLSEYKEFVHFGLTSQDVNNTAVPLSLMHYIKEQYVPFLNQIITQLQEYAREWKSVAMLARTHGQPASPTILGKEIQVFSERLECQLSQLNEIKFSAKFGGATGNFNAHYVAYPNIDWVSFANFFVEKHLRLTRSQTTTQIEHYDNLSALFDCMARINTILIDFSRDIWGYISMNYFKQKINKNEVGSSAMPHKVNPIDFENAEGNLGIANAIFQHLSAKLPISRLQRDLTDSTVLRNLGVPMAHTIISFESLKKGMSKLMLNTKAIDNDLENNWEVVAEAIQTILRRENYPNPYEVLKQLTRNNERMTPKTIKTFIDGLSISESIKTEIKLITPFNYTGVNLVK